MRSCPHTQAGSTWCLLVGCCCFFQPCRNNLKMLHLFWNYQNDCCSWVSASAGCFPERVKSTKGLSCLLTHTQLCSVSESNERGNPVYEQDVKSMGIFLSALHNHRAPDNHRRIPHPRPPFCPKALHKRVLKASEALPSLSFGLVNQMIWWRIQKPWNGWDFVNL